MSPKPMTIRKSGTLHEPCLTTGGAGEKIIPGNNLSWMHCEHLSMFQGTRLVDDFKHEGYLSDVPGQKHQGHFLSFQLTARSICLAGLAKQYPIKRVNVCNEFTSLSRHVSTRVPKCVLIHLKKPKGKIFYERLCIDFKCIDFKLFRESSRWPNRSLSYLGVQPGHAILVKLLSFRVPSKCTILVAASMTATIYSRLEKSCRVWLLEQLGLSVKPIQNQHSFRALSSLILTYMPPSSACYAVLQNDGRRLKDEV